MNNKSLFTWVQLHNLLPIVLSIVLAVLIVGTLKTRIAFQTEKTNQLSQTVDACLNRVGSLESTVAAQSLEIKALQPKVIAKPTTAAKKPTPTPTLTQGPDKVE